MMSESRKTLRARIQAVLAGTHGVNPNANICEPGPQSDFSDAAAPTMRGVEVPPTNPKTFINGIAMEGIYRVHFAGFDRVAYQAMEDTLLRASQEVRERFVPTDPVSMALGASPDVVVINLNHPDATQLGKTLRPAPGVPVVWVSISPDQKGVGQPGTPLFMNLVKAMQDVLMQRKNSASSASSGTSGSSD
jgi:hypothetical protein